MKKPHNSTTHGMYKTSTYSSWAMMLTRCNNKNTADYHRYGARGIAVCERWSKFEHFLEDMGIKPHGLTLDRKDNDLGYSKENCVWATRAEQARNRHNNVFVTLHGERMTFSEAARKLDIWKGTLHRWITAGKQLPEGLEII